MSDGSPPVVAGVELGGTKTIVLVGRGRSVLERESVPTTTPDETLGAAAALLAQWAGRHQPRALGIAAFGPVSIATGARDYGHILPTTKPGWAAADVVAPLAAAIDGPHRLHTDVSAAALAEARWGAARDLTDFVYVTIGTGIGMGIVANGMPIAGRMHPEAGHLRVRRVPGDDFAGVCTFHGDCLEGLASGPAITARAGRPADTLSPDDPAWRRVADAIAEGFAALIQTLAPQAILLGGGVGLGQPQLLPMIRAGVVEKIAGYLPFIDERTIEATIIPAALGAEAGPLGALTLAEAALVDQRRPEKERRGGLVDGGEMPATG